MKKYLLYAAAALLLAPTMFAAENPWLGTWKLNRDKSTFTGSTTTIENMVTCTTSTSVL